MVLGIGTILLASGVAIGVALITGRSNTVELLRERHERLISEQVERVHTQLDPVQFHLEGLAQRIESGALPTTDLRRMGETFAAVVSGMPQIDAIGFARPDLSAVRAYRHGMDISILEERRISLPEMGRRMEALRQQSESTQLQFAKRPVYWGDMIWDPNYQQPLINLRAPVLVKNKFAGALGAVVTLGSLSRSLAAESTSNGSGTSFILYGDEQVLAHPSLINEEYQLTEDHPLPLLATIHDPVLARIWSGRVDIRIARPLLPGGESHLVEAQGRRWIFVYRRVTGFGDQPWLVGRYFPFSDIDMEVDRLRYAGMAGAIGFALVLAIAWRLGRIIRRPILQLGEAANRMQQLEFDAPPLGRQRLRELDEAAHAFNSANAALTWFGNYVPRRLVNRLIRDGEDAVTQSKEREVTVMFTDLVGFTAMSESMTAPEVAQLLNEHFALMAECIEAEDGTIDKFIGDAVMAVWGGLKRDEDHAAKACRAALKVAECIAEDNIKRRASGRPVLRLRIGLHSGAVVVGNIGAPGRINYTVVGDTVNTAQRMEQLAREHMAETHECVVLASGETVAQAAMEKEMPLVGRMAVKGRSQPVDVYLLIAR